MDRGVVNVGGSCMTDGAHDCRPRRPGQPRAYAYVAPAVVVMAVVVVGVLVMVVVVLSPCTHPL